MVFPYPTQFRIACVVVLLGLAGGLGYRLGTRAAVDAEVESLRQQLQAANARTDDARRKSEAESRREEAAQTERDRTARKVRGLDGAFKALPPSPCQRWTADELRLLEAEREAYRTDQAAHSGDVLRTVPRDAADLGERD